MSNDDVYASGLLVRALDPATQPDAIRAFMQAEIDLLRSLVHIAGSWLDVGCGTGRHLAIFRDRLRIGLGVDYEHAYIAEARRAAGGSPLHFVTGDATRLPVRARFDLATCLTNTWGTMSDKPGVLAEMRRSAERRILSVFSERSIPARREWYRRFGHPIVEETPESLLTAGGLRSEHFTEARLRALVGECTIAPCTDVGYIVRF
ncbi:MAG TPA: class I SAM-dependent methyltransferase [Vicinamibacterales bacterium]|nr:class I SAM-dependent methyltransferase [Vicinamibacterales bacterium]